MGTYLYKETLVTWDWSFFDIFELNLYTLHSAWIWGTWWSMRDKTGKTENLAAPYIVKWLHVFQTQGRPEMLWTVYCADVVKFLEDGDLQTLGMFDYDEIGTFFHCSSESWPIHWWNLSTQNKLSSSAIHITPFWFLESLHAGEMFTFGYSTTPPYISYRVISKDGFMQDPVPIII